MTKTDPSILRSDIGKLSAFCRGIPGSEPYLKNKKDGLNDIITNCGAP